MKKLIFSFFAFGIISSGISQAVSDRNTIPVGVNLNKVLRLTINSGGNIEFTFNTIDQYKNGISGATVGVAAGGAALAGVGLGAMYMTNFTVSSSTKWELQYGAEGATMLDVDDPANTTMTLDNVGFSLSESGAHGFTVLGAVSGVAELVSVPTDAASSVVGLQQYPVVLIDDANAASANAGDGSDNDFQMVWRCGTAEAVTGAGSPAMNTAALIEQGLPSSRYVANVLFNLIAK
jgi:hypothetical protein